MTAPTHPEGLNMTDKKTLMRGGFEAQRKAGMNVDWFTWQIAWHDALFQVHDIAGDALLSASKPAAPMGDRESIIEAIEGAIRDVGRGADTYMAAMLAADKMLAAFPAAPAQSGEPVTMDDDELAEFRQTAEDFEDNGETSTPYDVLMNWAERGFLDCTHFELTNAGKALIGKPVDVVHFATPQNLSAPQPSPTAVVLDDEQRIAIEAAVSISLDIENECHDGSFLSDVSVQALRNLLDVEQPVAQTRALTMDEYHEDYGNVVWWTWEDGEWLGEPAWIGTPSDSDWPGYHTHWTRHPDFPAAALAKQAKGV
jgi:hypothetical protein